MLKKLQRKFVVINMTMVTTMLFVIFCLVYHFTQRNLEMENISMMKAIAANPFHVDHPDNPSSELKLPFFILQLGIEGELVSAGGGYYDLSDWIFLRSLIEESNQSRQETGVIEEHNLRYLRVKMPRETILVFSDISSERNTLTHLLQSCAVIGLISFFVFLGISIFLAKWAVKPVAKAWQQQKQFIADASHELKTPLTVVMTNTELLQCDGYNDMERKQFLQNIALMSQQMKRLIEKMLELAKTDNQQTTLPMGACNLSKLVLDAAIFFEGVFVEKGLWLESSVEPDINVWGNEESLRQLIDILLDNAQKYSYADSVAHICLYSSDRRKCCIKVSNCGTPIPQQELTSIFQRFYRTDKARSRDGGFGLGLSIAENIVTQHSGKIWAESQEGINSFFVELRK